MEFNRHHLMRNRSVVVYILNHFHNFCSCLFQGQTGDQGGDGDRGATGKDVSLHLSIKSSFI